MTSRREPRLLKYSDLPDWMKDNEFILTGYRPPVGQYGRCLGTICAVHNETGNIWSHLIGAVIFVVMAFRIYALKHNVMSTTDMIMFGVYFVSVITCLTFSFVYHALKCHSQHVSQLGKRFDYCGISLLITGSFVSVTHYVFPSVGTVKPVYLTILTMIGLTISLISLMEKFGSPAYRSFRAKTFVFFGIFAALPFLYLYLFNASPADMDIMSMISVGAYYITGAAFYATRFPEKMFPGKFDIIFHSHQIFHVFVVIAALIHLFNIENAAFTSSNAK